MVVGKDAAHTPSRLSVRSSTPDATTCDKSEHYLQFQTSKLCKMIVDYEKWGSDNNRSYSSSAIKKKRGPKVDLTETKPLINKIPKDSSFKTSCSTTKANNSCLN